MGLSHFRLDNAQGIANKKFSSVEVMQAHLKRINQVNPIINAMVQQLDEQSALNAAAAADQQLAQGNPLGPLHGLPVTIKDHIKVKDFIVTCGCVGLQNNRCHEDATVVKKLKQAGAIVIGITNMPEMGVAFETDNSVYGRTNNPYDVTKTPGGSSGGEAAIIASGGSPLGIGSDAGGSIRLPAHFCGISGLKPTQYALSYTGNVPGDGGITRLFATIGPLARFVEDLKLSLPIISAYDGSDPYVSPSPLLPTDKAIESMRIGYIIDNQDSTPSAETVQVMQDAVDMLRENTAAVTEVDFLDIDYIGKFLRDTFFYGGDQGNSFNR
ncbi:MAG: amidase [Gammaproteobacteria bacterium]|nr:amidase [Gammaproteobacteria bacterium]